MASKALLFCCWLSLIGGSTRAEDTVSLEVVGARQAKDESSDTVSPIVYVGDTFQLKVKLSSTKKKLQSISIEGIETLRLIGQSQSQQISVINGQTRATTVFVFDMAAKGEGTFSIGPARATYEGGVVTSQSVTVVAVARPAFSRQQSLAHAQGNYALELQVDKDTVFLGELVVVRAKMYYRGKIGTVSMEQLTGQGFIIKRVENKRSRGSEIIDEVQYNVIEEQFILLPLTAGAKEIPPIKAVFMVPERRERGLWDDLFFGSLFRYGRQKTILSNNLSITVERLPPHAERVDAVGQFNEFSISVDQTTAQVNEPLSLQVCVTGVGNLPQIEAPKLSLPDFVTQYSSKTVEEKVASLGIGGGSKRFDYVLQVRKAGTCEIPSHMFTYFDPTSRSYKQLTSEPIMLTITPAPQVSIPPNSMQLQKMKLSGETEGEATMLGHDIHFIEEDGPAQRLYDNKRWRLPLWLFFVLVLLMPAVSSQRLLGNIVRSWQTVSRRGVKQKDRIKMYHRRLEKIKHTSESSQLYNLFLDLLAMLFATSVSVINEDWIVHNLRAIGWSEENVHAFTTYLTDCARCMFAKHTVDHATMQHIFEQAERWLSLLSTINVLSRKGKR